MRSVNLAFIALAFAGAISSTAISRTAAHCPNRRTLITQMIGEVKVATFECVDHVPIDFKAALPGTTQRANVSSSLVNVARQFQNFAGGPADTACQCAVLCNEDFCTGNSATAPAQSDCEAIDDQLSTVTGPFFVPSGQGIAATLGTCQGVWINEPNAELEYCFQNFGQLLAVTYYNCVVVSRGGQGGCIADNFLWFAEFLTPGEPILIS